VDTISQTTILDDSQSSEQVLASLDEFSRSDVDSAKAGVVSGLYDPGQELLELANEAYRRFLPKNALYFNLYPSVEGMEQDLVRAGLSLLRAPASGSGNVTSGGTESIMLAVKAARDFSRARRPDIEKPNMVLPVTAHPAFHKAAHYLGLDLVVTPVDAAGFRADVDAFEAAITDQTILAVGSAPNFSHGTVDPISDMSEIARKRDILFHVDGCIGGLYLSYLRRLGLRDAPFDFSLPGVTSISADLHKYGYAPKNASLVLYRHRDLRQYAWFVNTATTEYVVVNPTVQSTRTAGPIAAAWAVMSRLGHAGYEELTGRIQQATNDLIEGINRLDHVRVLADPEMCVFTLASGTISIFELDDEMRDRGWMLTPQCACGGGPENLHVTLHDGVVGRLDEFLADLGQCAEAVAARGPAVDVDAIRSQIDAVKDEPLAVLLPTLMQVAGLSGPALPDRLAPLNTVLNLLPSEVRDAALTFYLNQTR